MDESLELPDDGLRDRIRKGFEANATNKSKKIDGRPKTPHTSNKKNSKNKSAMVKKVVPEKDDTDKQSIQKKVKSVSIVKKPVVLKLKEEITDTVSKQIKIPITKSSTKETMVEKKILSTNEKQDHKLYVCHKCDKTYKSKNGVIKHIEKCR